MSGQTGRRLSAREAATLKAAAEAGLYKSFAPVYHADNLVEVVIAGSGALFQKVYA